MQKQNRTIRARGDQTVAEDEAAMCLDCGCGKLNDSHGDPRHITMDTIRSAAEASEIPVDEALKNIADGLGQAQGSLSPAPRRRRSCAAARSRAEERRDVE